MSDPIPCECALCILAGCTKPPVLVRATKYEPEHELHGTDLNAFYAGQERKDALFGRLKTDLAQIGMRSQRGDA